MNANGRAEARRHRQEADEYFGYKMTWCLTCEQRLLWEEDAGYWYSSSGHSCDDRSHTPEDG